MKILIWLIIALAVVVWFKRAAAGTARAAGQPDPRRQRNETMVQCAHCGVHFPVSEAVAGTGDAVSCSVEHRRLG